MFPIMEENRKHALLTATQPIEIGRVAAGTTLTKAMVGMMMDDFIQTGQAKLWLDQIANSVTTVPLDVPISIEVGANSAK